ncbi:MAG: serine/threonine-protein kinase [Pirellulaceae bacterium]|nr:serine/threonine-protein kinase [Pirellulaceae bacterium]MDP6719506.1 serine/threonine-protein kinase [Pirellulaceae bacterium]
MATHWSTKSPHSGAASTHLVTDEVSSDDAASKTVGAHEKDRVLAVALSEYCRLKDEGTAPQIDEFCRRFPSYHKSIQRMVNVEETLDRMDDIGDVEWPEVGSSFMGFDVLHELGVGAFARVYLAAEPALGGRLVAVKIAMFGSDEAETLGKLVHPNVVPVHSVHDDPESGMTAVCMPYLGSATLSDVIEQVFQDGVPQMGSAILQAVARREIVDNSSIDLADDKPDKALRRGSYVDAVVRLGIQMTEALAYTHARGVLHRDLKPSNVLITPAGQPKLLDFNLACDVETEVNRLGGTLPYMPPEQINDVFLRPFEAKPPADPRSDIFACGIILYELFTGELPFGNPPSNIPPTEAGDLYWKAQQTAPRPIQELNPAIESQTARLIESCIAPDPDCRPANAAVVAAELRNHFSLAKRLRRWSSEHKRTLIGAGIVLFAMLASLSLHLITRPPLDRRLYDLGLKAMKHERFYDAIDFFDQARQLNQDEHAIRFARGRCYQALKEYEFANREFASVGKGQCDSIVN